MTEATAGLKPDGAPGAPDTWSELDQALADFETRTAQQTDPTPEPDPSVALGQNGQDPVDALLAEWSQSSADHQRIADLEGRLNSAQSAEFQRQEREAALKWAVELQAVMASSNPN